MSGAPAVSVVVASHNPGQYLAQAVESVLGQTLREMELIVVDDASSDGSHEWLLARDDPRLVVLRNERNLGQTASLNRGLARARGRFVARMDADDIALPQRLAEQTTYLESRPDIDICGTQVELIDPRGQAHGRMPLPREPDSVWAFSILQCPFVHPTVMLRGELVRDQGLRFDEGYVNQDFELWSRLLVRRRGANLPAALLRYRVHEGSMTVRHHEENLRATAAIVRRRLDEEDMRDWLDDAEVDELLRYLFADRRLADEAGVDRLRLARCFWTFVRRVLERRPSAREFRDLAVRRILQSGLWPHGSRRLAGRARLGAELACTAPGSLLRLLPDLCERRAIPAGGR